MIFFNRQEAGKYLADALMPFKANLNTMIISLPRGGVPVGQAIAWALHLPMDILIVRKIGSPDYHEFAIAAIASGDVLVWNQAALPFINIKGPRIQAVIQEEYAELKRREQAYRGNRPYPNLKDKEVILVDDGIATGTTAKAATEALRQMGVKSIVLAVPVAAKDSIQILEPLVDELICLNAPENFNAVGQWYQHFEQVSDDEVKDILQKLN